MFLKINNFISVRLEGRETTIYIRDSPFKQCKGLVLSIPVKDIDSFNEINSIDEAAELYSKKYEFNQHNVWNDGLIPLEDFRDDKAQFTPEQEFWVHSSNLQTWVEHNYDTRLLHSNLAFPLLQELVKAGDLKAVKAFKDEVAKRLSSGYYSTVVYLIEQDYLENFNSEEIQTLFEKFDYNLLLKNAKDLLLFRKLIKVGAPNAKKVYINNLREILSSDNQSEISTLLWNKCFDALRLEEVISISKNFNFLNSDEIPFLLDLFNIVGLTLNISLSGTILVSPSIFIEDKRIMRINLEGCNLSSLPSSMKELKNLKRLILSNNPLKEIPEVIHYLISLEKLNLSFNSIKIIPDSLDDLLNLESLDLSHNCINEFPFLRLNKLTRLNLSYNEIESLPLRIGEMQSLRFLNCDYNNLKTLPESIGELIHLERLDIESNNLNVLPESLLNSNSLKIICFSSSEIKEKLSFSNDKIVIITPPYTIRFFFEFGGGYFWGGDNKTKEKYGYNIRPERLPLTSNLIQIFDEIHRNTNDGLFLIQKKDQFPKEFILKVDLALLEAHRELGSNFMIINQMYGL